MRDAVGEMGDARRTRRGNGLAHAERARDGVEDAVGAQDLGRWRRGQHVRVREGALDDGEGGAGVGGGAAAQAAVRAGHAAQAADAAAAAARVAAAVGYEAEDAAEGRHGGVDAVLDAAPGVLEPDDVVYAELDGIHLIEAHLDRVGDDGGAGDPGVGDGVLGVLRLGFDQADGGVGGLVDGVVGHLALLRCVDAQQRFARFQAVSRFEHGRFRAIVDDLNAPWCTYAIPALRLSSVERTVSASSPSTSLSVAT